jgi:hypothetical protein
LTRETLKAWPSDAVLGDAGIMYKILPPRRLGEFHQGGMSKVNLRELKATSGKNFTLLEYACKAEPPGL